MPRCSRQIPWRTCVAQSDRRAALLTTCGPGHPAHLVTGTATGEWARVQPASAPAISATDAAILAAISRRPRRLGDLDSLVAELNLHTKFTTHGLNVLAKGVNLCPVNVPVLNS